MTEIDVKATMKNKPDVDRPAYRILGGCNPEIALDAIGIEPRVGAMLPCNVILPAVTGGVEVRTVDLVASMQANENAGLDCIAGRVRDLQTKAIAGL